MSSTHSKAITVELPSGVRHYHTTAFALSDEAYDALTAEDGWEERGWAVKPDDTHPLGWHLQKVAEVRGHQITVFPPRQPRTTEQAARDILAESMTPVVADAEDEAWRERGWRESPDRDDGKPVSEEDLMQGYGLAVHADELRRRRVPHALRRDLGVNDA